MYQQNDPYTVQVALSILNLIIATYDSLPHLFTSCNLRLKLQQTADLLESAENLAGVFKIKGDSSSVLLAQIAESFIEVLGFSNQEEV